MQDHLNRKTTSQLMPSSGLDDPACEAATLVPSDPVRLPVRVHNDSAEARYGAQGTDLHDASSILDGIRGMSADCTIGIACVYKRDKPCNESAWVPGPAPFCEGNNTRGSKTGISSL